MTHVLALTAGTELVGDYRIERVLGAGGFGITYLAEELALARDVTIKEYFPGDFAARVEGQDAVPRSQDCEPDYQWGLDRFIEEAQTLARFDHRNIVRVYRYFRANNTGYMVLHFEEGQSLKSWLKGLGRAPRQRELDELIGPLLDALEIIHKSDFLHRDIAPDNIIVRNDGSPVLIDFGSARGEIAQHSKTVSALVKPGYSPYEQYAETGKQQGPWTDIYALAATLYHAVTGKRPPDAPSRVVTDELVPSKDAALSSYRAGFLAAIDRALALDIDKRPQSVAEWRGALLAPDPPKAGWFQRTLERSRNTQSKRDAAKAALPGAGSVVPPPPDAPAEQGQFLDYVDSLQQKSRSKLSNSGDQQAAAPAAPQGRAEVKPVSSPPGASPAPAVAKSAIVNVSPATRRRRKAERPRPVRDSGRSWRPLAFRLLIGAGIAAAAVGLQERVPALVRGTAVTTTNTPAPPAKTAPRETRDVNREVKDASRDTSRGSADSARTANREPREASRDAPREVRDPSYETRDVTRDTIRDPGVLTQIKAHQGASTAIAYTDDGRLLVTTGADSTLKIWNPATGALIRPVDLPSGPPTALAVLGRRAVTGHSDGTLAVWDLDRGEKLAQMRRSDAAVWSIAFAGDTDRFVSGSQDSALAMWDARASASPLFIYEGHDSAVQAVAYSPRNALIASGGADRVLRLWDIASTNPLRTYRAGRNVVTSVAFSPDGRILAAGTIDGTISLRSTSSHRLLRVISGHRGRVTGLAFSPAGDVLASTGADGSLRILDVRRLRPLRNYNEGIAGLRGVTYSPDGRRLAAAGDDGIVRFWDVTRPLAELQ